MIKENDDFARRGVDAHIVDAQPESVVSGRSLEDVTSDREHVWHSNKTVAENVKMGALKSRLDDSMEKAAVEEKTPVNVPIDKLNGATRKPLPSQLSPVLATLVDTIPQGDDWLNEIKYDGYRMVCRIDGAKVRIYSRNGKEWTNQLPSIAKAVAGLNVKSAWLDGEVAVVGVDGRTSFQKLQSALSDASVGALVYFIFDVPYLNGYHLRDVPLLDRKKLLRALVPDNDPILRYGLEVRGKGEQFFAQACKLGLEGAVSKRVGSTYKEGVRSKDWVKVECGKRQEFVIGGFTDPRGGRQGFGALLLGVYEADGSLHYAGRVGTGFDDKILTSLRAKLQPLERPTAAFASPPRGYEAKGVHWVKPTLVAEVAFTEWTHASTLRHPSFQGLREDKRAADVTRDFAVDGASPPTEEPSPPPVQRKQQKRVVSSSKHSDKHEVVISSITISHPDKILFPEASLTKRDLAKYYEKVGPWIVPHLQGRPLSLVRCPNGWQSQCFYQKHADVSVSDQVARLEVPEGKGTATYMAANSPEAVIALLQWGVTEFHPWGSRKPKLDRPDRLIFDFDPDDAVAWPDVATAATLMRTLLLELGLTPFLKTTGGKGLHVVVPIQPELCLKVVDEAK